MSYLLKQSQTTQPLLFLLVQSSDHVTGLTGATPTVTLSKNGGAFASPAGAVTEVANGWYAVAGNATDSGTLGPLLLHATAASADPCDVQYQVVAFDPLTGTNLGLSALPTASPAANGGLPTVDASNGVKVSVGTGTGQINASSGKVPATLASTDVTGNVASDVQTIKTQTVTCAAGVTVAPFVGNATAALAVDASGRIDVGKILGTASAGAAGYVGIDWGHVNAPTTAVNLSGTTISTSQAVASVSGAVGSVTGSVGSVTGAVGSVTGNVGGNVTGSVGSIASGGITNASLAADTGLATIRSNTAQAGGATSITLDAGASATNDSYKGSLVRITGNTGVGQSRLITGYNGTTKVATVDWAWTTNPDATSTFAVLPSGNPALNSSLQVATTASDPWATALPGSYTAGQAGYIIGNTLDAAVSTRLAPTVGGRTLDVSATGEAGLDWANIGSPTTTVNLSGTTISTSQAVASVSGAVGSVTGNVGGNVTGSVGSISGVSFPTNFASLAIDLSGRIDLGKILGTASAGAAGYVGVDWGHVNAPTTAVNLSGTTISTSQAVASVTGNVGGSVGSVTAAVTVGGYSAGEDPATLVLDATASSHNTAGTIGAKINAAASAGDPWSTSLPGTYTAGQAGYILGTNLNATVSSRLAPTVANRTLDVSATGEAGIDWANVGSPTTTVNLSGTTISTGQGIASVSGAVGSVTGAVGSVTSAVTVGSYSAGEDPATLVLNATATSYNTAGTIGNKINSAASAGDPWSTALPGSYAAGTAGAIVGALPSGVKVGSYASGQDPATLIAAWTVVNTTTFGTIVRDTAAVLLGNETDNSAHTTSSFADVNDSATTRVTSTNTTTGRTVTLH